MFLFFHLLPFSFFIFFCNLGLWGYGANICDDFLSQPFGPLLHPFIVMFWFPFEMVSVHYMVFVAFLDSFLPVLLCYALLLDEEMIVVDNYYVIIVAVYSFDANLSNTERAAVHVLCLKMGMKSKSTG